MEKETTSQHIWRDYLVIGWAVSLLLILIDSPRDGFYQIIPGIVMLVLTGVKENAGIILGFAKKYWPFVAACVFYCVYFKLPGNASGSIGFPVTILFVTLSGYCFASGLGEKYSDAFKLTWIFLLAVILLGISKMIRDNQLGYFMDYTAELVAVVVFAEITLFFLDDKRYKIAGGVVSVWSVILLFGRKALDLSRIGYIKAVIPAYLEGTTAQKLFGRGSLCLRQEFQEISENTFAALLYDYGALALILYLGCLAFAVYKCIKTKDSSVRKVAVIICTVIIFSTFLSIEYWGNIGFILYSCIGILLYRIIDEKEAMQKD